MQVGEGDKDFFPGTFSSFRECGGRPYNYQPDYNIFYTAAIAFSLRNMLPHLSFENAIAARNIIKKAIAAYPHYQKTTGFPFYNFWPRGKNILPHTYFLQHVTSVLDRGDDADDTVLMLMSMDVDDSLRKLVKKRMVEVSNLSTPKRQIRSTNKKYRRMAAYSTYLGYNIPVDFDFAVHCNLLYFMHDSQLPFVEQDTATVELLRDMVQQRKYVKTPVFISPYYVKRPILLYHLARLMGRFKIDALEPFKPQVIKDIKSELKRSKNLLDKVILTTSLLRLGISSPQLTLTTKDLEKIGEMDYPFCQARAAYGFVSPFKQIFLHFGYFIYYFYCTAYNKTLLLEYLVERNKRAKN